MNYERGIIEDATKKKTDSDNGEGIDLQNIDYKFPRFLQKYNSVAVKALQELFDQAQAGYGIGEAVFWSTQVLVDVVPRQYRKFIPQMLFDVLEKILPKIQDAVDIKKVIKDLQGNFGSDNEAQMKGIQLLKGLATSDDPLSNKFMKALNTETTRISKEILGGGESKDAVKDRAPQMGPGDTEVVELKSKVVRSLTALLRYLRGNFRYKRQAGIVQGAKTQVEKLNFI